MVWHGIHPPVHIYYHFVIVFFPSFLYRFNLYLLYCKFAGGGTSFVARFFCLHRTNKRYIILEKQFHNLLKFHPFFIISRDHWIKNRIDYLLDRRKGKFKRHLVYYTKCRAICFSIVKSLLFRTHTQSITAFKLNKEFKLFLYKSLECT